MYVLSPALPIVLRYSDLIFARSCSRMTCFARISTSGNAVGYLHFKGEKRQTCTFDKCLDRNTNENNYAA